MASATRKKITKSLDDKSLERMFGDIEVFLATFPKDESINKASIRLVVAIMKAIEDAIGFYVKHTSEAVLFCILLHFSRDVY